MNIDEKNLKQGVLGLVIALVEIIKDALRTQALKRMEGGGLTEEECERLGRALMDLEAAIGDIKEEQGLLQTVQSIRDDLDDVVDQVIDNILNPEGWSREDQGKVRLVGGV